MNLIKLYARAYIYHGDLVADCPRGCGNTEHLVQPQRPGGPRVLRSASFRCSYCELVADIEWPAPDFLAAAMDVLMKRPIPHTRNWYPAGHEGAVRFGVEHGQTVDDLREENVAHGVEV